MIWIAPILVALITAFFAWLEVVRRTSGRIATTEASKLWEEAADLREVYQSEIARLRVEIDRLDAEVENCEGVMRQLREENTELQFTNRRLLRRVEELERISYEESSGTSL
jgi:predicted nuclease with TOPRIM domain